LNEQVSCLIDARWLDGLGGNCGRRLRRPCRSYIGCYVKFGWARTAWIDITIHSQRIEHVALITDGDHRWLPALQERIAPRLEHLPKRLIGVVFVAHQVCHDELRRKLPNGHAVMTAGIAALGPEAVARIVKTIAVYDDFCHANDPYEEHDFGSFEADGQQIFFKIDYFDKALNAQSSDPSDPSVTERVITIMLADEY
jgi:Protein of unknown function (DUF3768)